MKDLVVFDFDGMLVESKQFLQDLMGEVLVNLFDVVYVVVILGGDWLQFEKQVVSWLLECVDWMKLWLMLMMGIKLYWFDGEWCVVYVELFEDDEKQKIFKVFDEVLEVIGFVLEKIWGEWIEDCGSQIMFFVLGQEVLIEVKYSWDFDFVKCKVIQVDLQKCLLGLLINMGGVILIDIMCEGVDKVYGLKKLCDVSGIVFDRMMFIGDVIFLGGNDYLVE